MFKVKYILPLIFLPTSLIAQEMHGYWSLGFVAMQSSEEYINHDSESSVLPYVRYETDVISIGMPDGITWKAYNNKDLGLNIFAKPRFHGLSDSDNIERATTGDVGVSLKYDIIRGTSIKASVQKEMTGEHGGFEANASISQFIPPFLGLPIVASTGIKWMDANLSNYLYGVGSDEAMNGLSQYDTGVSFVPYASLSSFYSLSSNVSLFSTVSYKLLPDNITASPLVKNDNDAYNVILGIGYNF